MHQRYLLVPMTLLLVCGQIAPSMAATRYVPDRTTAWHVATARHFDAENAAIELSGGVVVYGRVSMVLRRLEFDDSTYSVNLREIEIAPVRYRRLGIAVGLTRRSVAGTRLVYDMFPVTVSMSFSPFLGGALVPWARLTKITGLAHDDLIGDLGLDAVWLNSVHVGLEQNLNQDLRYNALTLRVGHVRRF